MPDLREVLRRFRPVAAPGAPGLAGVPRDRLSDVAAELVPVFDALGDTCVEADRLRSEAETTARERREQAADRARSVVADAGNRMAEVRAAATAERRDETARRQAAATADGQRRADEIKRSAAGRLPAFVDLVRDALLAYGREAAPAADDGTLGDATLSSGRHAEPQAGATSAW